MRTDGRLADELRPLDFTPDYSRYADGSVMVEMGDTRVLTTAMVESQVPQHCLEENIGWVSAEYRMLPSSNPDRQSLNRPPGGRSREIQRLIGRSLRAAVDLSRFQNRTIWIDCTVIQADGGTRTAAVNGGFVALVSALQQMKERDDIDRVPLQNGICAVSVGKVETALLLDLCADEDKRAEVDMNVVMNHEGELVEVQGTAEGQPFPREELDGLVDLAQEAVPELRDGQLQVTGEL